MVARFARGTHERIDRGKKLGPEKKWEQRWGKKVWQVGRDPSGVAVLHEAGGWVE